MQLETTGMTHKTTLRTPIVASDMPASRASLRGTSEIRSSKCILAFKPWRLGRRLIYPLCQLHGVCVGQFKPCCSSLTGATASPNNASMILENSIQTMHKRRARGRIAAQQWTIAVPLVQMKTTITVIESTHKMGIQGCRQSVRPLHGSRFSWSKTKLLEIFHKLSADETQMVGGISTWPCNGMIGCKDPIHLLQEQLILRANSQTLYCLVQRTIGKDHTKDPSNNRSDVPKGCAIHDIRRLSCMAYCLHSITGNASLLQDLENGTCGDLQLSGNRSSRQSSQVESFYSLRFVRRSWHKKNLQGYLSIYVLYAQENYGSYPYATRFCNILERRRRGKRLSGYARRAFLCRLKTTVPCP
jgi:hypothetical protein